MSLSLQGPRVLLRQMHDADASALLAAAADPVLRLNPYTNIPSDATISAYMRTAQEGYAAGHVLPFVIVVRITGTVVGSTRFWKMDSMNKKLEIGHTWISSSWQRTFVNTESKYLMLCHAFQELHCVRVQFQTDELNLQSRTAILRLGAREEGVLRNERIMKNGRKRNSVCFSIIDEEWPAVKKRLESRLS